MTIMNRYGCVKDLALGREKLVFADLHIHSKYSRATSPQMDVVSLHYWAKRKGIGLMGTGDFTHPQYFQELKDHLEPHASGFYQVRGYDDSVLFVPTVETSHIYKQSGKTRRVHMLTIARSLESAQEINRALARRGNIASDGRPILGLPAKGLVRLVRDIDDHTLMVPAHIWTPWFSVLGEKSGFDSLEECFEEELDMISAIETGLSSDPEMNWRLSQLDPYTIISNSDAHSPAKVGRECNAFSHPLTWEKLRMSLREKAKSTLRFTVEFFPEEGKYHWPGHSNCKMPVSPADFLKLEGLCPVCHRPLTNGVASRLEMLADRPEGYRPKAALPSVHLVPLDEVIAEAMGKRPASKAVQLQLDRMLDHDLGELELLIRTPLNDIEALSSSRIREAVQRVRQGQVQAQPGYDGVYGKIGLFTDQEKNGAQKRTLSAPQLNLIS